MASYQYFVVGITDTSVKKTLSGGFDTERAAKQKLTLMKADNVPFPYRAVYVARQYYNWS